MILDDANDFPLIALGTSITTKRGMCVGNLYFIDATQDIVRRLNAEWLSRQPRAPTSTIYSDRGEALVDLVEQRNGRVEIRSHNPLGWRRE